MYNKRIHIHFIGIGGVGMSGIATILAYQGYTISGCDIDMQQKTITDLRALGIPVASEHASLLCNDKSIDVVVYSSAIHSANTEIMNAQQRGIAIIPRARMLAELMRTKYSIAVTGAHGKTTTTSLISHLLIEAGLDPTVIIGGTLKNISSHTRFGQGNFLIAEADESDRSLLQLQATFAVVTNIDLEHLETYADINDIKETFRQFLSNLPFYGKAAVCIDNPHIQSLMPLPYIQTIKYGIDNENADICAKNISLFPDYSTFTLYNNKNHQNLGEITLFMPGKHNILNSLAAICIARELDIPDSVIIEALATFKGVDRRFSYRGIFKGAEIFDDYGHHPQEIACTLSVAQQRAKNGTVVVFQPHRYTRTKGLWQDFIQVFLESSINHLIITDIYAAGEKSIETIHSKKLVEEIQALQPHFCVSYAPYDEQFLAIQEQLIQKIAPDRLVLLLGAGKINHLSKYLLL